MYGANIGTDTSNADQAFLDFCDYEGLDPDTDEAREAWEYSFEL